MLWGTVDIAVWAPHTTENLPIGLAAAAHTHEGEDDCIGSETAVSAAEHRGREAEQLVTLGVTRRQVERLVQVACHGVASQKCPSREELAL